MTNKVPKAKLISNKHKHTNIKYNRYYGGAQNPLKYDDGFNEYGRIDGNTYTTPGKVAQQGINDLGLPKYVRGNPELGCSCSIAYLHAVGKVTNGQVETDYMCDVGWHNFLTFQVQEIKKTKEKIMEEKIIVDKDGEVTIGKGEDHVVTELEEF